MAKQSRRGSEDAVRRDAICRVSTFIRANSLGASADFPRLDRRLELARPRHQILEQLLNQLSRSEICQIAFLIEPLSSVRDHHFRQVDRMHVEKDEHLAQMVLSASSPQGAYR